jgi:hypothetical protein
MADLLQHPPHHDPTNAGIVSVPNGPETGDEYATYPDVHTAQNEKAIFAYLLRPDDSYTPEGVYWADLSIFRRLAFVASVDNKEAAKELGAIGRMIKNDPLSPFGWYFRNAVLPGAGLGLEGYVEISRVRAGAGAAIERGGDQLSCTTRQLDPDRAAAAAAAAPAPAPAQPFLDPS